MDPKGEEGFRHRFPETAPGLKHYYGDITRRLFLVGGVLMIVFAPIFQDLLPVPTSFVLLGAIMLSLFAGVTNPKQFWINVADVLIATSSFLFFETAAFSAAVDWFSILFLVRQTLAVVFFLALYFSAKTLRGMLVA